MILSKYHFLLYYLVTAISPRMMVTLDNNLEPVQVSVRVGQSVDTVAVPGRPKTITGFQTHNSPVLLQFSDRAELATDKCMCNFHFYSDPSLYSVPHPYIIPQFHHSSLCTMTLLYHAVGPKSDQRQEHTFLKIKNTGSLGGIGEPPLKKPGFKWGGSRGGADQKLIGGCVYWTK